MCKYSEYKTLSPLANFVVHQIRTPNNKITTHSITHFLDAFLNRALRVILLNFCVMCGLYECVVLVLIKKSHSVANRCLIEPGHEKMCLMPYANNKGADQPAHLRSLISAFVVPCQDRMIPSWSL